MHKMETNDIYVCPKCGILFDTTIALKKRPNLCSETGQIIYGNCPVCHKEIEDFI